MHSEKILKSKSPGNRISAKSVGESLIGVHLALKIKLNTNVYTISKHIGVRSDQIIPIKDPLYRPKISRYIRSFKM
jgi:hypothetical protein